MVNSQTGKGTQTLLTATNTSVSLVQDPENNTGTTDEVKNSSVGLENYNIYNIDVKLYSNISVNQESGGCMGHEASAKTVSPFCMCGCAYVHACFSVCVSGFIFTVKPYDYLTFIFI